MSRIDVVDDGNEFKILVNFIQHGVAVHNAQFANQKAREVKADHYPTADLHLLKEKSVSKPKLTIVK